jgi:hypothetical protein
MAGRQRRGCINYREDYQAILIVTTDVPETSSWSTRSTLMPFVSTSPLLRRYARSLSSPGLFPSWIVESMFA